jgi:UPF0716 family protein affecting phage T7 exclusion
MQDIEFALVAAALIPIPNVVGDLIGIVYLINVVPDESFRKR